ncbi:hypothetical protein LRR81_19795 [Metabacillus sp. GX 13764]|uniref:hypothetical protein n=1 Tax=Metabacillus kandeliae TaxID=2900151 RepID=UPI001E40D48E|nr:hypothetical protein [Metabacillus kandeliae]MCD7036495.1 hypothetical protein [Metabacillus kandeliae]
MDMLEEMAARFFTLSKEAKKAEDELKKLKKEWNDYFDSEAGANEKGALQAGPYQVQRIIRVTECYEEEKAVARLEEENLSDCILTIKKPDKEKIEAAVKLGLLEKDALNECTVRKISKVVTVKEK